MATINGTSSNDLLLVPAGNSNDTVFGLAGNDSLESNSTGSNILNGGDGDDELFAFTNDQLFGDAGNDKLTSDGRGNNKLNGGDGNDTINADRNDSVFGDAGDDVIYAGRGGNTLTGGLGKDVFTIADLPDTVNTIADFNPVSDTIRVNFAGVTQLSDLTFTQSGADSIISVRADGKQLAIVKNTLVSNLNATTFGMDNQAPTITSGATTTFVENGTGIAYTVIANDLNLDTLTYSISGTDANQFNINSSTGAVTFKTPPNFEAPTDNGANNVYNINVIASDGSLAVTKAVAITVTDVNVIASGKVQDGPIAGATLFFDANQNGIQDAGEPSTLTDANGNFDLAIPDNFDSNSNGAIDPTDKGRYVVTGGTDTITGQAFSSMLKALPGSTVITPLTTLVNDLVTTAGATPEAAQNQVKTALGLPSTVDLSTFDALEASQPGSADGQKVLAAQVAVQTLIGQIASSIQAVASTLNAQTVSNAISNALINTIQQGNPLNLGNTGQVQTLLGSTVNTLTSQDNTLNLQAISNNPDQISQVIASAGQAILNASNTTDIFKAQKVAQGNTTQELTTALQNNQSLNTVVANNTGIALTDKINTATISSIAVATEDNFFTSKDRTVSGNVLSNDSSVGGGTITIAAVNGDPTSVGQPITLSSGALLTLNSDGTFIYNPNQKFDSLTTDQTASDFFSYTVAIGNSTDITTVTLIIRSNEIRSNEAPTITAATFSIDENSVFNTLIGQVVANDPDKGDKLTYAITSGNTDINGNGKTPFAIDIKTGEIKTGEIKVNDPNDLDFETNSIFNLKVRVSDDLSAASEASVTVSLKNLADPVSTNYDFTNLPKLGTTSKGQDILLGGFSGLFFEGTNATNGNLKFTTLTDRGPNGEPTGQNRPFFLPEFQPEIVNFELNKTTGALSITKRTGLFRADGTTKLTGLPNLQAGANGTAYTDEIGVNLNGGVLTNDPFGIDSEGLVIDDNGNYWVVDEYRPAIYQFDVNGKMLNRFIPKGTAASPAGTANDFAAGTFGTEVLPEVYAQRRANRGFEAVALEGNKLYAFIQSAIDNPDNAGDTASRASRNLRILEFDIVTKTVTGEYLYLLDDISASGNFKTDKLGDAVSLGNKKFAVVERDDIANSDSNKLIYRIDLANATNINNLAVTFPTGKTTIEQLTESELATAGIKPVTKNLIANAAKSGYTGVEKLEGLALVDSNTLALINDNDFNVAGTTTPAKLGLLSLPDALPITLKKFQKNDSDIFSVGSGTNPKPSLSFTVNSNAASQVGEVGVFIVDDADGKIDGLAPNASGYAEKALARAKVIFSAIDNNPNGFSTNGLSRLLEFNDSDKFRFYAINDKATTTSSALANKSFDKVNFSPATILNFTQSSGVNKFTFNNLDITIAPSDAALPIGTGLQDKTEGEVLDLTQGIDTTKFSQIKAEFTVNREAAFNNFVGFYKIENAKGDIKKSDGSIVSVGQSGYIQAAVAGQISGIDLSVSNQSTQTTSGIFKAGSIFAPFIVINGSPSAILDSNPNNDPAVYFPFLGANTDKVDHIRLLGNNTFGFEDLPSGGDFDYNDIIVKVTLTPIA